jgi:glycosyltransferase involved in cell wall biosynthesis
MKIALIGPFPPFRSGIARHTRALADALSAYGDVGRFSFSRQYPKWLFPGESDRDENAPVAGADYCIDSIDPLSWRRTLTQVQAFAPDIAVIPAWTFFVAPALGFLARALRRDGVRVVSIVHNAADHEAAAWKSWLLKGQIRAADAIVTHTASLADTVRDIAPDARTEVSPHPLFSYPAAKGTLPRRARLELLTFGLQRPYKGAGVLVDAMARCRNANVALSIVGEFWNGEEALRALIGSHRLDDRIELVPRYVADEEAAEYFHRADIVVLPYTQVTGSGVAPLAFHYRKPVIASDLEGFRDMIEEGVTGWRVPAGDPDALAAVIKARAEAGDAALLHPGIEAACARLSWSAFARTVLDVAGVGTASAQQTIRWRTDPGAMRGCAGPQ